MYETATAWRYFFQEVVIVVKGISRQVIVVHSPDKALFDQAMFILKDKAVAGNGVTDDALLKEAKRLMAAPPKRKVSSYGIFWACSGAALTGIAWLLTVLL